MPPPRWIAAPTLIASSLIAPAGVGADELMRDFRGRKLDAAAFRVVGPRAEERVLPTSDGLRVRLPDGEGVESTGIALRFPVRGDFEIVATYEIRQLTAPMTGPGVGVGLAIAIDSPTGEALTLGRFVVPGAGEVFAAIRGSTSQHFPARGSRMGKLRLTRRGTDLTLSATDGADPTPHNLQTVDYPDGDLASVRLVVDTGGAPAPLDAVFKDLRITADELVNAPKPPRSFLARRWPVVAGVAVALLALALGVFIVRDRRAAAA